jgi:predicted ATPase
MKKLEDIANSKRIGLNLKRIVISGFKSIKEIELPMRKINILIGANGSGKSNLISVFAFLNNLSIGNLEKYVNNHGGADSFFHFGMNTTEKIVIDLTIGKNGYFVSLLPNHEKNALRFEKEFCTITSSSKVHPLTPSEFESGLPTSDDKDRVIMYTKRYLNNCRIYHFHDTSSNAEFKKKQRLINDEDDKNIFLEKDAGNIAPFLYLLKNGKREGYASSYKKIVSAIKVVAPFFKDFHLIKNGESVILKWKHSNNNSLSADTLSDGTARFICLATVILQPSSLRPGTIIFDEPELGLHPAALAVLADLIQSTSDETQFICSTQSVTFANLFSPEDFIVVDAESRGSTFRRLEKKPLIHWLDEFGVGDIWCKNLIGGRPAW